MGSDKNGSKAPDIVIKVPVGTEIVAEDGETVLADMVKPGQTYLAAKVGRSLEPRSLRPAWVHFQELDQSGAALCRTRLAGRGKMAVAAA